jgi:hypothetical protein
MDLISMQVKKKLTIFRFYQTTVIEKDNTYRHGCIFCIRGAAR